MVAGSSGGGAGCAIYDGEAMAKKGIVFVSINYRVGIFGFFSHPDLTKESGHNASGNYGLMDQLAALKWVKNNISTFGGDPSNVTIAGRSASSMSVNCLVASPFGKGLFKHTIAESGASFLTNPVIGTTTLKQAEDDGERIGTSITELRNIPAAELMKKQQGVRGVVIDGYVLPKTIAEIFASGQQNDVDLHTGWNEDDGVIFGQPKSAAAFKSQAEQQYGPGATSLLKLYPTVTDEEAAAAQAHISRDLIFGIQNYTWANVQANNSKHKVYLYHFTRRLPATGDYKKYGAFHTGEVAYAYDNLAFVKRCPWEQVDHHLAAVMSGYWANFARTGNPNGKGLSPWPSYNTKTYPTMILDETQYATPLPGKAGPEFLAGRIK